jgi:hydrogenase maturation protein HypF
VLAVGGQYKSVFALAHGRQAFLSHHLGELDDYAAFASFVSDIDLYEDLFALHPRCLAHDLHPDYSSTRYALERATASFRIAVQHHHAHLASCLVENGLDEDVIGVIWDGTGYGLDGAIWGGEFLVGGYREACRAAHLKYVGMPGGEEAIRHPWRMALAHARSAKVDLPSLRSRRSAIEWRVMERLVDTGHAPRTSSMGRLFDAVAAVLDLRDSVRFEGQAAMELEWLAMRSEAQGFYPFEYLEPSGVLEIDPAPLFREIVRETDRGVERSDIARRFHSSLVEMIAEVAGRLRRARGIDAVALSGGVFLNRLLAEGASARLESEGFRVYLHRLVPSGDGGLSLGQVAVAASRLDERSSSCV